MHYTDEFRVGGPSPYSRPRPPTPPKCREIHDGSVGMLIVICIAGGMLFGSMFTVALIKFAGG